MDNYTIPKWIKDLNLNKKQVNELLTIVFDSKRYEEFYNYCLYLDNKDNK